MIVRRLLTIAATAIVLLAVVSPATAQLQRDDPLTLEQSDSISSPSSSFHTNELADARILDRLSRVLDDDDSLAFLESTSAAVTHLQQEHAADKKAATMKVDPILDDTGSFSAPKVDTEKFPVKPVIDATLVPDLPSFIEYTDAPLTSLIETSADSSSSTHSQQLEEFLEGFHAYQQHLADSEGEDEMLIETSDSVDADAEAELENGADTIDTTEEEAISEAESEAEDAAMIEEGGQPILDNTGGDAHTPKVDTEKFTVKPVIDSNFVADVLLQQQQQKQQQQPKSLLEVRVSQRLKAHAIAAAAASAKTEVAVDPIIDNTGSQTSGGPTANLTQYSVKPAIEPRLMPDDMGAPANDRKTNSGGGGTLSSIANKIHSWKNKLVGQSLMESAAKGNEPCSTCPSTSKTKQDLPVVTSPVTIPSELDQLIAEQQHAAVNHLIKPHEQSLSIRERELQAANQAAKEAADAHERFQEYKEQLEKTPLIQQ